MNNRIKEARTFRKISQESLAIEIGLTRTYITLIEGGTKVPSPRTIKDIARVLEVNETWLLTGEGEMLGSVTREQEIASITAQLFKEEDNSFRLKLIKLISQMSDDDMERCKAFIDTLLK